MGSIFRVEEPLPSKAWCPLRGPVRRFGDLKITLIPFEHHLRIVV